MLCENTCAFCPSKHSGINELFDIMTENWGIDPEPESGTLAPPALEDGAGHGQDEEDDEPGDDAAVLDDDYEDPDGSMAAPGAAVADESENAGVAQESFDEEPWRYEQELAESQEAEFQEEAALEGPADAGEDDPELKALSKRIEALKLLGSP